MDGQGAFNAMQVAFVRALNDHPALASKSYYTFSGETVRIRVVGNDLASRILPTFSHLRAEESDPRLRIDLWDASVTGVPCPVDRADLEEIARQTKSTAEFGFVWGSAGDRYIGCLRPDMFTWFDREGERIVTCVGDYRRLSLYEHGKPLHFPLLVWHGDRGIPIIHAGLVSKNDQGVLFVGKGGAGKTTAALSCLRSGFDYLGDDYIGLQSLADRSFTGHSLYNATWIWPDDVARYPDLIPHASREGRWAGVKALVLLCNVHPERLRRAAPIRVVLLPRLGNGPSAAVRVASKGEALFALAPSSIILLPSSGAGRLNSLAQLVERLPCYWLELGSDLGAIPQRLEELLAEVSSR